MAKTLYQKVWEAHVVRAAHVDTPAVMYVDLHLVHEVTSPQAFDVLRARGLKVRQPRRTVATIDHSIPTTPRKRGQPLVYVDDQAARQVEQLVRNCDEFGIALHGIDSDHRGIVHVIGPELGLTQPGMTVVCGDSHTSTHGAFGALAFGIGTTEVGYVLATQTLLQRAAATFNIRVDNTLPDGVSAKDLILAIIARIGMGGGTGSVLEYSGSAIRALSMEQRMTVCNMSIEAGARAGMVAPDDTTYQYLAGRPHAPKGADWEAAHRAWRALPSDADAAYDREVVLDAATLSPMITYGTNPGMGIAIDAALPVSPDGPTRDALAYMGLNAGERLLGKAVQVVFIGSCTNARLEDLREAASILRGRKVASSVTALVVPGSQAVKKAAEAEGLHTVFEAAGAQWREPGCSMCLAMNGDTVGPGQYAVSTSNRNFKGRQGPQTRTFLASPATAAASAVAGAVADARKFAP